MAKRPSTKYRKKRALYDALIKFNEHIVHGFELPIPAELSTASEAPSTVDALLSPAKAATQLGISRKTLANWRCSGISGLRHVQLGSRVFYRQSDIHEYVSRNTKSSTSDRGVKW